MSVDVYFPEVSKKDTKIEGVVATWFVNNGSQVNEGQLIAEVQVEKVDVEVYAPSSGTIRVVVGEQEAANQSSIIAYID